MGGTWIIQAPSKINLHLRVGDRRSNGYHELESLFLCLEFGDTLWFEIRKPDYGDSACSIGLAEGIEPSWVDALVGERNIITQAAALFRERTGFDKSVQVRLKKRIPLGGGMGGGSSNAASTLAALNVLAGTDLSQAVMHEMAVTLGSDVPFFLSGGGVALVSGCGDIVQPIQTFGRAPLYADAPFWVVLVNPGFSSDTEAAYALLDEARRLGVVKPPGRPAEGAGLVEALEKHPAFWPYENDFLPVFLAPGPNGETTPAGKVYRDILAELRGLKADFWGLSGAGSTCFGIFSHKGVAEQAVRSLLTRYRFVELTIPLAHSVKAVLQ
ncbi:MAG: 4-(cytidine 5'-diphospho)-2-C-methyl-D-erythritol kinase [Spirochaetaceae bacterium]|jgi:4-diphosphocytidyl-2-C-methyl-D-erythritol kinase|nr:4-(cytidine 5'-diphospho)-2-C-methyl-D-erythritol kinase [Spirochaetaceae bacterium]